MFFVYVLRSEKTGRRYVGSCQHLDARFQRHNNGEVPATRHGLPWILVHNERFSTRGEAMRQERYFKTGRGRDELDRIERSRLQTAPARINGLIFTLIALVATTIHAQEATTQSIGDSRSKPVERAASAATPADTPRLPELSQLDEVFKQSSIGKAADESRIRIEMRKLQNQVVNDPAVVAAKAAAESAPTDLQKRDRLRDYYKIYYGNMRARTGSAELRAALDKSRDAHLALLNQPRVRPSAASSADAPH